jgi:hypothetical protein
MHVCSEVSRNNGRMMFVGRWKPKAFRKMPESFRELSDQFKDCGFRKIRADSFKKVRCIQHLKLFMNFADFFLQCSLKRLLLPNGISWRSIARWEFIVSLQRNFRPYWKKKCSTFDSCFYLTSMMIKIMKCTTLSANNSSSNPERCIAQLV